MALSIIQSTTAAVGSGASCSITLGSTPTVGNLMIMFLTYSQVSGANSGNTIAGWTKQTDQAGNAATSLAAYTRVVQSGDGTGYTFTTSLSSSVGCSGVLIEVGGVSSSTPVNQISGNFTTSAGTTNTVTPSVVGGLPIAGISNAQGNQFGTEALTSISGGWSLVTNAQAPAISTWVGKQNALTTDTVTGISCSIQPQYNNGGAAVIFLIAPGSGTGPVTIQRMSLLGCGA